MKVQHSLLASGSLIGIKVVNQQNEHLGKIEELMVSLNDGKIVYAVMSFGGILNFGDKFFALPWRALSVDIDNKQIILHVDKESLKNAPGFDKSNWPDMSDEKFTTEINLYYSYKPASKPVEVVK